MSELVLITLPIGNLDDITLRARNALNQIKSYYAEDTRVFKETLKALEINFQTYDIDSFHEHSESKLDKIIGRLKNGEVIGLVSDAGSPVISDPAYPLIKKCLENNIPIKTCPGVSSVLVALEVSGLPTNPFHYWGFIGRSSGERKNFFEKLSSINGTHIFFESPHRMLETLKDFFEIFPNEEIILARELTKKFEEVVRVNHQSFINNKDELMIKGEFVLLFNNERNSNSVLSKDLAAEIENYIDNGGNLKTLAKIFSKILDRDTKEIYSRLNQSKQNS